QGRHVPGRKRERPGKRRAEQCRLEFHAGEEIVQKRLELRHAPERTAKNQDDPWCPLEERLADSVLVLPFMRSDRRSVALARPFERLALGTQQEARLRMPDEADEERRA